MLFPCLVKALHIIKKTAVVFLIEFNVLCSCNLCFEIYIFYFYFPILER